MLVETAQARSRIRRMAAHLACPSYLREDFEQEGQIHLWQKEAQCPGKSLSWYCEACRFYVRDQAERGRSVDSPKRRHLGFSLEVNDSPDELRPGELACGDANPFEHACAADLMEQLEARLGLQGRRILLLLLHGYSVREAAASAGLSHPAVVKHRKRIARLASELGFVEPRECGR